MDLKLTGKKALVSGSTAGIGLAIATGLAYEGARVIVNGRTDERVRAALSQIGAGDLYGFAGDLSHPVDGGSGRGVGWSNSDTRP